MKTKLIALFILGIQVCFATEVAFQGNPPSQDQVKRDHPIIFTMDILWGQVEFVSQNPIQDGNPGITEVWGLLSSPSLGIGNLTVWDARLVRNNAKIGLSAGIGVALNRMFNLGLNWKYIRSGRDDRAQFDWKVNYILQLGLQGELPNTFDAINPPGAFDVLVDASNHFKNRLHIVDLILQTSHWMTSKLRFQPFGGLRYLYRETISNTDAGFTQTTKNDKGTFVSYERFSQSSLAVVFGTDVKYIISKDFFFFSTFLSQIAGDFSRKTNVFMDNDIKGIGVVTNQGIFDHAFRDSNLNIEHSWEQKFGFAWEHVFGDDWLLSFRLFVELQEQLFKDCGFGATILF